MQELDVSVKLRRSIWFIHAANVEVKFKRFARLATKYSPSQPRVPAGNPTGGQWTDGGGANGDDATGLLSEFSAQQRTQLVEVIRACIAEGVSLSTDDTGFKSFAVTYLCAGGRSFELRGAGHKYRGIIRDPFR